MEGAQFRAKRTRAVPTSWWSQPFTPCTAKAATASNTRLSTGSVRSLLIPRRSYAQGNPRREKDIDRGAPAPGDHTAKALERRLDSQQIQLVKKMKHGAHRFDPAQYSSAEFTFQHLTQSLEVRRLLQTHSDVSQVFAHGPNKGQ